MAVKHAGTTRLPYTFHGQSFEQSSRLCLWARDRHLLTAPCILFLNCLYINNKEAEREGGNLRLAPPPSPPPLQNDTARRRVSALNIVFMCASEFISQYKTVPVRLLNREIFQKLYYIYPKRGQTR